MSPFQTFSIGQISWWIVSGYGLIPAGAFFQNLLNWSLDKESGKIFNLVRIYLAKIRLLAIIPSKVSSLISFMHCGHFEVRLFTICTTA